jgi:hypothetical protein
MSKTCRPAKERARDNATYLQPALEHSTQSKCKAAAAREAIEEQQLNAPLACFEALAKRDAQIVQGHPLQQP